MRLLLDENLSPRLCELLAESFEEVASVLRLGLGGQPDVEVWKFAGENDYVVVSKDSDYVELAIMSASSKLIWLRLGNCSTSAACSALIGAKEDILRFVESPGLVLLVPQFQTEVNNS